VKGGWGHDLATAFGRDEARDMTIAQAVRGAVGDAIDIICDVVALAGWTPEHAIHMARRLDDEVGLYWLEDPLPENDLDGYRALRAAVTTRICTGEKGWTGDHFARLIGSGALDVIMVDPGKAEGVTGVWNVIRAAANAGLDWNAHSWSSALNTAASLHLAAASDNVLLMELKPLPSPMQHELVREPIVQVDGWVAPPDGPGLGVEVDEAVVRAYRFD
jgi:L-alanine-DL-glutamate epimerase-like enolase superfamily enzyme